MDAVQSALWYVESHLGQPISLDEVARASGASTYHLTRAFAAVFGLPLMRYVRRRRLSEAARLIAAGAAEILPVALQSGYGSHEAFSRAFKDEFGITPEAVRELGEPVSLDLLEPFVMSSTPLPRLQPPRVETLPNRRFIGLIERHTCAAPSGIPGQWQRFSQRAGEITGLISDDAFGICFNGEDGVDFDYMTAVMVRPDEAAPKRLVHLDLPTQKYAVFHDDGHISGIRATLAAIWSNGLSEASFEPVHGATLEKYGPEFNPQSGLGGYEIWVTIK